MNREQLIDDLAALSEADFRSVCGRLGVAVSSLGDGDGRAKGAQLVALLAHESRMPELLAALVWIRPYLAPRYDQADPLGWLERLEQPAGMANPPQITSNIEKLDHPGSVNLEADGGGDWRSAPAMREAPTAKWDLPSLERAEGQSASPYQPGDTLRTRALFFGREVARQLLRERLQKMRSCAIVGLPFIGKSSLAYHVLHFDLLEPAWNGLSAFLELSQLRLTTRVELLNHILSVWYRQMGQDTAPKVADADGFVRQVLYLGRSGYQPLLCLDALSYFFKSPAGLDGHVLRAWSDLFAEGQLAIVVTSRLQPALLLRLHEQDPASLGELATIELGLLSDADARKLVRQPAARHHIYLPAERVTALLALCGRHPFFLQLGAALLLSRPVDSWQEDEIEAAYAQIAEPYFRTLWRALMPPQQSLLAAPLLSDPPIVVARQYRTLAQYGLLEQSDAGYRPFSTAFGRWLALQRA